MHYQGGQWLTYRPTGQKTPGHEAYYKYVQSDKLDYHRAQIFMLALQRMCEQHNIKDFYLEGWTHIDWSYNGIDKEKIYTKNDLFEFSDLKIDCSAIILIYSTIFRLKKEK